MFAKLFKPAPAPLTKITTPTAELLPKLNASPEAQALYQPGQSPGEYLAALEANKKPMESVNLLAHGMPEKDAVKWASESSKLVGDKLTPADQQAVMAADKWLANPTPENQAAAAQAAAATNGQGPGGWTAQAAAWAQPAGAVLLAAGLVDKPAMPDTPRPGVEMPKAPLPKLKVPKLNDPAALVAPPPPEVPQAKPAENAAFAKKLKPFLDLGKKIASGQA